MSYLRTKNLQTFLKELRRNLPPIVFYNTLAWLVCHKFFRVLQVPSTGYDDGTRLFFCREKGSRLKTKE